MYISVFFYIKQAAWILRFLCIRFNFSVREITDLSTRLIVFLFISRTRKISQRLAMWFMMSPVAGVTSHIQVRRANNLVHAGRNTRWMSKLLLMLNLPEAIEICKQGNKVINRYTKYTQKISTNQLSAKKRRNMPFSQDRWY